MYSPCHHNESCSYAYIKTPVGTECWHNTHICVGFNLAWMRMIIKWTVLSGQLVWQRVIWITNLLWHSNIPRMRDTTHRICYWAHNSLPQIVNVILQGGQAPHHTWQGAAGQGIISSSCMQQQEQETPIGNAIHFWTPPKLQVGGHQEKNNGRGYN